MSGAVGAGSGIAAKGLPLPPIRAVVPGRAARDRPLPRAVLLDMDDTIFDHTATCRAAIGRVRGDEPALAEVPLEELVDVYSRLLWATHVHVLRGRTTTSEGRAIRWQRLIARYAGACSMRKAISLGRRYRAEYERVGRPVPGAVELVRWLADRTTVGVVTNNTAREQSRKLRFLGLERSVDVLITSREAGWDKPDPRIFRLALRAAGAAPTSAVMIGDSWESDVEGALRAGIRPIWLNRLGVPPPVSTRVEEIRSFRPLARIERMLSHAGRDSVASARIITRGPVQRR